MDTIKQEFIARTSRLSHAQDAAQTAAFLEAVSGIKGASRMSGDPEHFARMAEAGCWQPV